VQVAVRRHLEAAAIDFLHHFGILLGVVARHEEGAGDAVLLQQVHVARDAALARVAAPGVDAQRRNAAADFVAGAVEIEAQQDCAATAFGIPDHAADSIHRARRCRRAVRNVRHDQGPLR
jgi:hypothetical protein